MHPAHYGFLTIMRYAIPRTHSRTLCRRSVVHSSGEHNFPRGGWRRQYSRDSSCKALSLCVSAMRCRCRCCCCLHNASARRADDPDILASPASTVDSNQRPATSQVNRGDGSLSLSLSPYDSAAWKDSRLRWNRNTAKIPVRCGIFSRPLHWLPRN